MDSVKILQQFGANLKRLRESKGREWTQPKLAQESLVDAQHISKLERGLHEPGLITILLLAKGLGCKPIELIEF